MEFRIGVNLGGVMVEGEHIYGDGIKVAARLENLADPGGICISGTVFEQVRDKLTLAFEDRGEQAVTCSERGCFPIGLNTGRIIKDQPTRANAAAWVTFMGCLSDEFSKNSG